MAFPNVPPYPGVPPLPRSIGEVVPFVTRLIADSPAVRALLKVHAWGIYSASGLLLLKPDSIVEYDRRLSFRVSDFPIQGGEFASYNKVRTPFDVGLTVTKGGSDAERVNFLAAAEKLAGSLDLLTVVTPEASYANLNLTDVSIRRTAQNGFQLLSLDLGFRQIRVAPAAQYTTARPLEPTNLGAVQTVTPSATVTTTVAGG